MTILALLRGKASGYRAAVSAEGSLTLDRGIRLLHALADRPDGLSVSELATALSTHRAGVYRLLAPLVEHRLVVRDPNGRHRLGTGLVALAAHVQPRLQEAAAPILQRLADELRATAALTVRDGDEAVVLAVVEPRSTDLHVAYRPGLRHPLDVAASGIAILAGSPPLPDERAAVREARARGYARSSGELLMGASGVGAPLLLGAERAEAAVSAVWVHEHDEAAAGELVIAAARAIASALR